MENLKAVLFDMDGTLVDSEWFYFKAWKKALSNYGIELDSDTWLTSIAGKTDVQAMDVLQERFDFMPEVSLFLAAVREQVAKQYDKETVPLMAGAKEILSFLEDRGVLMALVTSSKRESAVYHLERNGLMQYFKLLVTRTEVVHTKPDPEPYNLCVQKLGIDKQYCLALEDSTTGTAAAKAAGLTCYGVQSHEVIRKSLQVDRSFDNLHQVLEFLDAAMPA